LQITLDRHNAILNLNYCPLPDPPNFSLPSTFKKIVKRILPLVMALFKGTKNLFGPLLDDLDCVNAVKETMELQIEACM
jgi:hypothetical protein